MLRFISLAKEGKLILKNPLLLFLLIIISIFNFYKEKAFILIFLFCVFIIFCSRRDIGYFIYINKEAFFISMFLIFLPNIITRQNISWSIIYTKNNYEERKSTNTLLLDSNLLFSKRGLKVYSKLSKYDGIWIAKKSIQDACAEFKEKDYKNINKFGVSTLGGNMFLTGYVPQQWRNILYILGLLHLGSVSGLHLGILTDMLYVFRVRADSLIFIISMLYIYFIGLSASAVRSLISLFLFRLEKNKHLIHDAINRSTAASFITLVLFPCLCSDIGFLYSCICSLVASKSFLMFNVKNVQSIYKINHLLLMSFSVFVSSIMINLMHDDVIYPISILSNIILVHLIMLIAFVEIFFTLIYNIRIHEAKKICNFIENTSLVFFSKISVIFGDPIFVFGNIRNFVLLFSIFYFLIFMFGDSITYKKNKYNKGVLI